MAGGSAQRQADLSLIGIKDAANFRNQVLEQRDKVTENKYGESDAEGNDDTLQVLMRI